MPAQQEPLYVRRSLRVASMTPAKFGDDSQSTGRSRPDSPSRRQSGLGRNGEEATPLAGAGQPRRANVVDLSVGRGGFGVGGTRTPGNQYGRAYDLSDPFSAASITPFNRPYLNLDFNDGSQPRPNQYNGYANNTPLPTGRPVELDYPPSRDRQVLNLPSAADNILAETPSRFAFLPSLSRFTPFMTPKVAVVGRQDGLAEGLPDTPNIVATVKARRKSTTPRGKTSPSGSPSSSPTKSTKSKPPTIFISLSKLYRLATFTYNVLAFLLKMVLSVFMVPKYAAEYVLSRSSTSSSTATKKLRTPRRSSAASEASSESSLSIFSYIALSLGGIFISLFLFIVFRDLIFPSGSVTLEAGQPITQPIHFDLPKDIPRRSDLLELQSQLSLQAAHKVELETVLNGITAKIAALQESVNGAVFKQIDGLQKELTLLLQTIEQLEDSHNEQTRMTANSLRSLETNINSKLEALKKTIALKDEQIGVLQNGALQLRPEVVSYLAERFALKGERVSNGDGVTSSLDMKIVEDIIESKVRGTRGMSRQQIADIIAEEFKSLQSFADLSAVKSEIESYVDAKVPHICVLM